MRKVFALFMAATCILGASVLSKPKAGTTGGVKAAILLASPGNSLNFECVFVSFSGNTSLVDVSYDLKRYKGKNYMNLDKEKNLQLVVAKSSYNNSWKLSAADDTYSMTAEVSYKSADETKSDFAKKTR